MPRRIAQGALLIALILTSCGGDATQAPEPWRLDASRSLIEQVGYNPHDPRLDTRLYAPGLRGTCEVSGAEDDNMSDMVKRARGEVRYGEFGAELVTISTECTSEERPELCEAPSAYSLKIQYNARGLPQRVEERNTDISGVERWSVREFGYNAQDLLTSFSFESDDPSAQHVVRTRSYAYEAAGKLTSRSDDERSTSLYGEVQTSASSGAFGYTVEEGGLTQWSIRDDGSRIKRNVWDERGVYVPIPRHDCDKYEHTLSYTPDNATIARIGWSYDCFFSSEGVIELDDRNTLRSARAHSINGPDPQSSSTSEDTYEREDLPNGWRITHVSSSHYNNPDHPTLRSSKLTFSGEACRRPKLEPGAPLLNQLNTQTLSPLINQSFTF